MALARTDLYKSDFVKVRHVACHADQRGPGEIEFPEAYALVLPLRGAFLQHLSRSQEVLIDSGLAVLYSSHRPHRISHPVTDKDESLVLEFCSPEIHEINPNRYNELLSLRAIAWRNVLWRRLELGIAEPLEVEETATALLTSMLRQKKNESFSNHRMLQQLNAVKAVILAHPEERWSLNALSVQANVSPFYLTRMFQNAFGVSLYQYLLRSRLSVAVDLLLHTDRELTDVALDLGFSSHSHFTALFRKMVGLPPGDFRIKATSRTIAEFRKNLTA